MSTLIFTTASGSTYEVDKTNKRMRQTCGRKSASSYAPEIGEWKAFVSYGMLGNSLCVIWELVDGVAKATQTSTVVSMLNSDELN